MKFKNFLTLINVVGTFGVIYILLFREPPDGNKENISMIVGFLIGQLLSNVMKFYYPSSDVSDKKTDTIQTQTETIKTMTDKQPPIIPPQPPVL